MKKIVVLFVTTVMFITVLTGCKNPAGNKVALISDYKLLLYDNMLSGPDDTTTPRVGYRILEYKKIETNEAVPDKIVTLFGNLHTLKYFGVSKKTTETHNRIEYQERDAKGNCHFADFDAVTGELVYYVNAYAGTNRAYQSEVNDKSGEAEFLAYAKKLISQYASVEGCQVDIKTKLYEYDEGSDDCLYRESLDGYVNDPEMLSDYYAAYQFTFYKTLDGIRRHDDNVIEIYSTGEVRLLSRDMQDEMYADFADVKVDMEQAERLTKEALTQFIHGNSTVEIVPSVVATSDGNLWLDLEVFVNFGGGTSGYIYMIQLAEREQTQEEPKPSVSVSESAIP